MAEARTAEASAQGKYAEKTIKKKQFEHKMKMNQLDAEMASQGRFLFDSSNGGTDVLKSFVSDQRYLDIDTANLYTHQQTNPLYQVGPGPSCCCMCFDPIDCI